MKAKLTYNKDTKTLTGTNGELVWDVAVAEQHYIMNGVDRCMSEEALRELDGKTVDVNLPDGFAEAISSGKMYPKDFSMGTSSSPNIKIEKVEFGEANLE